MMEPKENSAASTLALPIATMPSRLTAVRHYDSDANLINRAIKAGHVKEYPAGFSEIPDREIRLCEAGRRKGPPTGQWLSKHYPERFDVIYVSDHTRAKESAGITLEAAQWSDVKVRIDPLLGERNWGRFAAMARDRQEQIMENRGRDPLHNPMPDGETLLETRHRAREFLARCAREFGGQRVLVFSHGEFIEALWAEIAHMSTEHQKEFFSSPQGNIRNGQVIEFARSNPETQTEDPAKPVARSLYWVRSSCPAQDIAGEWLKIDRRTYSPAELLEQAARYPQLDGLEGIA